MSLLVAHGCPAPTFVFTEPANGPPLFSGSTPVFLGQNIEGADSYSFPLVMAPNPCPYGVNGSVLFTSGTISVQTTLSEAGNPNVIGACAPCAASTALLDPVPTLLTGPSITTNTALLASGGRSVLGVAADGAAQLVLRIPVSDPNQKCPTVIATLPGGASQGSLQMLNGGLVDTASKMAFAVYTAPVDYMAGDNPQSDSSTVQRNVTIKVSANGQQIATQAITVIRPLVVMLHGLWDNSSSWFTLDQGASTQRFSQVRPSFNGTIPLLSGTPCPSATSTSAVPCATPPTTDGNALGLLYAAQIVEPQLNQDMSAFRAGNNVAALPVAAVRADFLGQSMGGLVARELASMPSYKANANFLQGSIHKLITIGTPHFGSPLPLQIINDDNTCVRDFFNWRGLDAYTLVTITDGTFAGAMADLGAPGDGTSLSPAITSLQNAPQFLPTAFIAGEMNSSQSSGIDNSAAHKALAALCLQTNLTYPSLVTNFYSAMWNANVMNGPSDAIVPVTSQLDGLATSVTIFSAVHSQGATYLGFGGPYELQDTFDPVDFTNGSGISAQVVMLLNTPVNNSVFFTLIP
jgi:pimeloyl-ACP methyl ester carboxylesterase